MNPPMDDEALWMQITDISIKITDKKYLTKASREGIDSLFTLFQEQKAASERLATKEAYELLYWKYKELNHQSVDMKFAEAYGILMEALQKPEERTDV